MGSYGLCTGMYLLVDGGGGGCAAAAAVGGLLGFSGDGGGDCDKLGMVWESFVAVQFQWHFVSICGGQFVSC